MGQRSIDYVFLLNEIIGNPILYKIYDWIYSGGSSIDKAIIARNIICLHCKYEPLLKLDSKVLLSIQSSYNLYLKDHVIQYLEMKNKVAEFISEILSRTGEYATELLDKFKTNMIAVFGFFIHSNTCRYRIRSTIGQYFYKRYYSDFGIGITWFRNISFYMLPAIKISNGKSL